MQNWNDFTQVELLTICEGLQELIDAQATSKKVKARAQELLIGARAEIAGRKRRKEEGWTV